MSLLSTFIVNPELSVVCFRRDNCKNGPFFAVREFDIKVIRSRDKGRRGRGPSEQAIRASIRQAVLNMNLKSERASKSEIRQLKGHGILGKRAPSCSLLCAEDMCRLLEAFGKDDCVRDLRSALLKDRKSDEHERKPKNTNSDRMTLSKRKTLSPNPLSKVVKSSELEHTTSISSKRSKLNNLDSFPQSKKFLDLTSLPHTPHENIAVLPQQPAMLSDSNGLDALYSALLAFSGTTNPISALSSSTSLSPPPSQEMESVSDNFSSAFSLPSPISISPTTSPSTSPSRDPFSFPSPKSPSSPLSDSSIVQRFSTAFNSPPDNYLPVEDPSPKSIRLLSPPLSPFNLSFTHPTVLRPRKKKVKSRLAAEISSLSSDILAKLIDQQPKAVLNNSIL